MSDSTERYVIGIDQSTQGTKAILFDADGRIVGRHDEKHRQIISREGWVSHDPEEIFGNVIKYTHMKSLPEFNVMGDFLNPCNGICLSALYDKAFDEGLISFSPSDYTVCFSSILREKETKEYYDKHFGLIVGKQLTMPTEYLPNREFLEYHYECIFQR